MQGLGVFPTIVGCASQSFLNEIIGSLCLLGVSLDVSSILLDGEGTAAQFFCLNIL